MADNVHTSGGEDDWIEARGVEREERGAEEGAVNGLLFGGPPLPAGERRRRPGSSRRWGVGSAEGQSPPSRLTEETTRGLNFSWQTLLITVRI